VFNIVDSQEISDRLEAIKKQSMGTMQGSVIKTVEMLCDLISDMSRDYVDIVPFHEEDFIDNAHIPVSNVQDDIPISTDTKEMPQVIVSVPEHKKSRKAKKGTTNKAKTTTRE
jgi:hypothetical protein